MSTMPYYYLQNDNTPQNDPVWLDAVANAASSAITTAINAVAGIAEIKLVVGVLASGSTTYLATDVKVKVEYFEDSSEIKIGDKLYPADLAVDTALSIAITELVLLTASAIYGTPIAAAGVVGLAIAGTVGYVYSKFVDPITEDVLKTLAGKDMVQFFDADGNAKAGMIFPDGIEGTATDAIHAFITHPSSHGLDLTAGHIQLDTDIFIDNYYKIVDGNIFQAIANRLDVSLQDFLSTSSGGYANDEYYAVGADGKPYVFYAESVNNNLDQKLAIQVTINDVSQVINVSTVYYDGVLAWGDALNGHSGNNLALAAEGGGYISGISFVNDLMLGSDADDIIDTNSSFLATEDKDTVLAGAGNDTITGGYGKDHIEGGSGDDIINGGSGDDTIDELSKVAFLATRTSSACNFSKNYSL